MPDGTELVAGVACPELACGVADPELVEWELVEPVERADPGLPADLSSVALTKEEASAKAGPASPGPVTTEALFPKSCATGKSQALSATKPVIVCVPKTAAGSEPRS
jgi:hypothetical protein